MHVNARHYAGDVHGVSWADSEQWVAENLPEVQRMVDLKNAGEVDYFGNYVNAPGYTKIDSMQNPMGAVNMSAPDAPVNVVTTGENIATVSPADGTPATDNQSNLLTMFGLNELFKEVLGRPFTDGDDVASVYLSMTPEEAREYLVAQPEALIYAQGGVDLNDLNRTNFLGEAQSGLVNTGDSNQDGVVNINDLLFDMGEAGIGQPGTLFDNTVVDTTKPAAQTGFGTTPTTEVLNPYYGNLVPMQITPGSDIMATNVSSNFFGIDPITNQLGLLSDPQQQNLMFRSGVAGFTDNLPTGFEFGIPAVVADVPIFYPKAYQDFLDAKEAEANPSGDK
jgi:hypothetical protein